MIEVRTPAAPVEVVTPIKPSEALRLGRLEFPQHSAGIYQGPRGMACAVGVNAAEDLLEDLADDGNFPFEVEDIFDATERDGRDGDAAVLAYLAERGL